MQREVLERGADLVLHVGDISYANGDVAIWDTFMAEVEPYASAAPLHDRRRQPRGGAPRAACPRTAFPQNLDISSLPKAPS